MSLLTITLPRQDEYEKYLLGLVRAWAYHEDLGLLLRHLHKKSFYSYLNSDEAREEDGKNLREGFVGNEYDVPKGVCSFLEFLIGVSIRMDYFCTPPEEQPKTYLYFWKLIKNLDLYDNPLDVPAVDSKIDKFLSRSYTENGVGGLFPLRHPAEDQRNVQIWYQMGAYINEHPLLYNELIREEG